MPAASSRGALLAALAFLTSCSADPPVHEQVDQVMGTVAQLKVVSGDAAAAAEALSRAVGELHRIESLATVHSDTSEVARLNHGDGWTEVGPDTDWILELAWEVAHRSEGAFDPTSGPLIAAWGFPDRPALPDSAALERARGLVGYLGLRCAIRQDVVAESLLVTIEGHPSQREDVHGRWRLVTDGMRVDLSGIAKGYGVDRAADALEGLGSCLVNVGGDLAVRGTRPDGAGWLIGVQDPRDPSRIFLRLRVAGRQAVATSGDYQRFFVADGVRFHHILDPRTGWPADELRSVTVVAPTCALADAWATAAFVLGPEEGLRRLEALPFVEGVLVQEDAAGELLLHQTSGFPALREP